jgi:hypothetical protein
MAEGAVSLAVVVQQYQQIGAHMEEQEKQQKCAEKPYQYLLCYRTDFD